MDRKEGCGKILEFQKEKCGVEDGFEGFKDGGWEISWKTFVETKTVIETMERKGQVYEMKLAGLRD